MKLRTHIALAGTLTLAMLGLIWYQSHRDVDGRLKKIMESAAASNRPAATTKPAKPSQTADQKPKEAAPVPKEEKPVEKEEVVVKAPPQTADKEIKSEAKTPEKPAAPTVPENDDFLASDNVVRNGDFKNEFKGWRYWAIDEETGNKSIKVENETLYLNGLANKLMGIAQSVKIVSGTVYRMSAKVRDMRPPVEDKVFLGARLALNAPGQKEHQVVWLYSSSDWKEADFVFTNRVTGIATLFFHTGYTTNSSNCAVKDIALVPANDYPAQNVRSRNGGFKDGLKGWNYWQIQAQEGSNLIFLAEGKEPYAVIKGKSGGKLMGLSQAVNVSSGAVYRLRATVKSKEYAEKTLFGARVALYAPGVKERQLVWTYATKDWEKKELVFTNVFTGAATLYFHTGYTTNSCEAFFKDISLTKKR